MKEATPILTAQEPGISPEDFQLFIVRNGGYGIRALNVAGIDPNWLGGTPPPLQGLTNRVNIPPVAR